ncbi:MAG: mechanosensitive ion channel family protein [Oscillospiraceae bacterium]|nr:mechanosensitive ion channel family protein [Oscillospiraceae bacterium]MBQ7816014.1 mechanosensitive ion channel family protein [Oscillospiraceae bacterium]
MNILTEIYFKLFGEQSPAGLFIEIIAAIAVLILFKIVAVIINKNAKFIAQKIFKAKNENIENAIISTITKPINHFITITGIAVAVAMFPFSAEISTVLNVYVTKVYRLAVVALLGMLAVSAVDNVQYYSKLFTESDNKTLLQFFIKIAKAIVIFLTVAILLKEVGFDVTGLITSLGLGGVVLALAAQDTASNLFSGIVILFDKPFAVGDWISVGGMEGIVEEMSFRSCRIRTFDNALISVPNSKLGSDSVTNWTKMNVRKTRITIALVYSTKKETLQKVCDEIKTNLAKYDSIKKDNIMVWFDNFNASSLDIVIQYHTYLTGGADFFALKEEIQYMIMDVVESNRTDFAFNTQTIIVENN